MLSQDKRIWKKKGHRLIVMPPFLPLLNGIAKPGFVLNSSISKIPKALWWFCSERKQPESPSFSQAWVLPGTDGRSVPCPASIQKESASTPSWPVGLGHGVHIVRKGFSCLFSQSLRTMSLREQPKDMEVWAWRLHLVFSGICCCRYFYFSYLSRCEVRGHYHFNLHFPDIWRTLNIFSCDDWPFASVLSDLCSSVVPFSLSFVLIKYFILFHFILLLAS